jgi:hypothetical protein
MNCKPGDLAVVIRARHDGDVALLGAIVKLTSFGGYEGGDAFWHYEGTLYDSGRWPVKLIADRALRPIRPDDGEDETLTWAGKPESINA